MLFISLNSLRFRLFTRKILPLAANRAQLKSWNAFLSTSTVRVAKLQRRNMSAKTALVILAEGAEEMEAVITIDVLRRGAVDVVVAGLTSDEVVTCSRGVVIKPDKTLTDAIAAGGKHFDAVVLPGGAKGAKSLAASAEVGKILKDQEEAGGIIAAICAGPIALQRHGIGKGKSVTSHPSVKPDMEKVAGEYKYSEERVVQDGQLITSRGPGTAFEFALKLVEALQGKQKVEDIVPPMLLKL